MNEILQKLVGMAPGLGQAAMGNGPQFASFMEGWQRAALRDEQRKRMAQQDQIAAEDRQRQIGRQDVADARAGEDQAWQQQQRLLSLGQLLNQSGAQAETLPEAEGAIDSTFGMLTPEQQTKLAPARDQALRASVGKVTSRQKAELKRWVEDLLNSQWVKEQQESDPDVTGAMPARIRQLAESMTGQTSFRKSDVLAMTETLEPAGKTRVPPMAGSFEDYVQRKFGDAATPEQILQARKEYQQSDDRAPRVTVNTGANDARVNSRIDRIVNSFNTAPIVKEFNEVQAQHQTIAQIVNSQWSGPGDMSVVFAFMKALDPNSVVRETEYANAAKSGNIFSGWAARFNGALNPNGGFLSEQVKQDFLRTIEARMGVKRAQYDNLRKQTVQKIDRIKAGAPETGDEAVTDYSAAFPPATTTSQPSAPQTDPSGRKKAVDKERRKFGDEIREWSEAKQQWVKVNLAAPK